MSPETCKACGLIVSTERELLTEIREKVDRFGFAPIELILGVDAAPGQTYIHPLGSGFRGLRWVYMVERGALVEELRDFCGAVQVRAVFPIRWVGDRGQEVKP